MLAVNTAVAIEWALAPASAPKRFAPLTALRSIRTRLLARVFRARHGELVRAMDTAVEEIATAIADVPDCATLEFRLDEQATKPSLLRALHALSQLNDSATLRRLAKEEPRASDWEWLGTAAAKHMELGGFYANEVARAVANAEPRGREFVDNLGRSSDGVLGFVSAHDIHADVAEALLATYRSLVCLLAIFGSARLNLSLPSWLALALAERFAHGQRQNLRFLASVPGFSVPEDVMPTSERFDLAKLTAEARAADERLRTMTIDPSSYVE